MAKWTERELGALRATSDYHAFGEATGYSKSFDAWEVKRRRIVMTDPTLDADEAALASAVYGEERKAAKRRMAPFTKAEPVAHLGAKSPTPEVTNFDICFFDIETTNLKANFGRILCASFGDMYGNITTFRADDPRFRLERVRDDRLLVTAIRDYMETKDIWVGWNSRAFDVPYIDSRLLIGGERPLRKDIIHVDPMYKAGQFSLALASRSLDNVSKTFRTEATKTFIDFDHWQDAAMGDSEALDYVVEHCEADIRTLMAVFDRLRPLIKTMHR